MTHWRASTDVATRLITTELHMTGATSIYIFVKASLFLLQDDCVLVFNFF